MSKIRKSFIAILAVIMCTLLALGAVLLIPKTDTANATSVAGTSGKTLDELLLDDYGDRGDNYAFDQDKLYALYDKLMAKFSTGVSKDTYTGHYTLNNVANLVTGNTAAASLGLPAGVPNYKRASEIGEFYITLAGKIWMPVFLTRARNDDIVLTLWLANSDGLAVPTSQYQTYSDTNVGLGDPNFYPSHMYATSYIRTVTLNNGGKRSTLSGTTTPLVSEEPSVSNTDWAQFTVSKEKLSTSIRDYIATPAELEYQAKVSFTALTSGDSDIPNGSYEIPYYNMWKTNANYNYFTDGGTNPKYHYSDWKDDALWLPSYSELGGGGSVTTANIFRGIWDLNNTLRLDTAGVTAMRSSHNSNASMIHTLTNAGVYTVTNAATNNQYLVRPALHLNLTKAQAGALPDKPEDQSKPYTAQKISFNLPHYGSCDYEIVDDPFKGGDYQAELEQNTATSTYVFKATRVGDYKLKANLKKSNWYDGSTDSSVSFTIHITNAQLSTNWTKETKYVYHETSGGQRQRSLLDLINTNNVISSVNDPSLVVSIKYAIKTYAYGNASQKVSATNKNNVGTWYDNTSSFGQAELNPSAIGGYVLWYKLSAPDHDDYIDYVLMEIQPQTLYLTISSNFADGEYGTANLTSADIESRLASCISVTDNDSGSYGNTLPLYASKNNIEFYVYYLEGSSVIPVDMANSNYWPVRTYYVGVRYKTSVADTNKFFNFEWRTGGGSTAADDEHVSYKITPKAIALNITAKSPSHTYGDDPATNFFSAELAPGNSFVTGEGVSSLGTITYYLRNQNNSQDGIILSRQTDAGNYKVYATNGIYGNYSVTFNNPNFVVDKRPITLQAADIEKPYGDDFKEEWFQLLDTPLEGTSFANGQTYATSGITVIGHAITLNGVVQSEVATMPALNGYKIELTVSSDNYDVTVLPGTLTIGKERVNMDDVIFQNDVVEYDGQQHRIVATNVPTFISISVTYSYSTMAGEPLTSAPVNAGEYIITAHFTHFSSSYADIPDKQAFLTITRKVLPVPTVAAEHVYDGTEQTLALNDFVSTYMSIVDNTGTAATIYHAEVTMTSPNHMFDGNQLQLIIDWEIKPKEITVSIADFRIDGETHKPRAEDLLYPPTGALISPDTVASVFTSEAGFAFILTKDGQSYTMSTGLAAGEYEISAPDGVYGNYKVTFVPGECHVEEGATILPELPPSSGGTTNPGDGDNTGGNNGDNTGDNSGNSGNGGGDEAGNLPNNPGNGSGSSNASDFFDFNWWWMLIILVVLIALFLVLYLLGEARRRREKKESDEKFERLLQMQMMSSLNNVPTYQQPMQGEMLGGAQQPAQLPLSVDENTLARAIAIAMREVNGVPSMEAAVGDAGDGFEDMEGFYDDISPEDMDNFFNK